MDVFCFLHIYEHTWFELTKVTTEIGDTLKSMYGLGLQ
jgi:hypothetical protein